jgi:hypothetical protein
MAKIYQDEKGLYSKVGGYIVRPENGTSVFSVGNKTEGFHFGGSTLVGMGKIKGRQGKYQEYWRTPDYFHELMQMEREIELKKQTINPSMPYAF